MTWLRPPLSKEEFLDEAEEKGAPESALRFLRSLPAAVFTSEKGLEHALSLLGREEMKEAPGEGPPIAEDGIAG
jgi:hypothetical protein